MDRIQFRRDTSANWTTYNPVLMEGEVGYETDTKKRKIGDGTNTWNNLDYLAAENISQELGDSENITISQKLAANVSKEIIKNTTNNVYIEALQYSRNKTLVDGAIVDGGRRIAVTTFIPCYNTLTINIVTGYMYSIHYYTDDSEESFVTSISYTSEEIQTVPIYCRYFRICIRNTSDTELSGSLKLSDIITSIKSNDLSFLIEDSLAIKKSLFNITEYTNIQNLNPYVSSQNRISINIENTNSSLINILLRIKGTYRCAVQGYSKNTKVYDTGWNTIVNVSVGHYDKVVLYFYNSVSDDDPITITDLINNVDLFHLTIYEENYLNSIKDATQYSSIITSASDLNLEEINGSSRVRAIYNLLGDNHVTYETTGDIRIAIRTYKNDIIIADTGWQTSINSYFNSEDGDFIEFYFYNITSSKITIEDVITNTTLCQVETSYSIKDKLNNLEKNISSDPDNYNVLYKGNKIRLDLEETEKCQESAFIIEYYPNDHRTGESNNQSMAIYNDYIFAINNGAGNVVNIYSYSTKSFITTVNLPISNNPHNNNLCFSNIFYKEGDNFPLALLSRGDYNTDDTGANTKEEEYQEAYIIHIDNTYNIEIIKTLIFKIKGANCNLSCFIDNVAGKLYTYNLVTGDWRIREGNYSYLCEFKLPDITNKDTVTFTESDIINRYSYSYMVWQGAVCHNGYMYAPIQRPYELNESIYNYSGHYLLNINLSNGAIENIVPINSGYEPEGIAVYNKNIYISFVTNSTNIEDGDTIFFINEYKF